MKTLVEDIKGDVAKWGDYVCMDRYLNVTSPPLSQIHIGIKCNLDQYFSGGCWKSTSSLWNFSVMCPIPSPHVHTGSVLSFPLHAIDMLVCPSTKTTASNMPWHLVQTQLVGVWIRPVILGWTAQLLSACTLWPRNAGKTFTAIPEGICILLLALFWLQNAGDRLWGHCHRNVTGSTGQLQTAAYMM